MTAQRLALDRLSVNCRLLGSQGESTLGNDLRQTRTNPGDKRRHRLGLVLDLYLARTRQLPLAPIPTDEERPLGNERFRRGYEFKRMVIHNQDGAVRCCRPDPDPHARHKIAASANLNVSLADV